MFLLLLLKNSSIRWLIVPVMGTGKEEQLKQCIIVHLNSKYDNINFTNNENTLMDIGINRIAHKIVRLGIFLVYYLCVVERTFVFKNFLSI